MLKIDYERRGAGPTLVLIHPLGGDRHVWDPVLDLMSPERDVLALDLPGFGGSPPLAGDEPPAPPTLAVAVDEFLGQIGVERPHVAGNSLGGWVALELALAGRARSVTAIAPAGLWSQPLGPKPTPMRNFARAALPVLPTLLSSAGARRLALAATVANPDRVPADDAIRLVRSYAEAPGYVTVNEAMRGGRFTGLDRIRVPLTFAWPDRDRLIGRPAHLPPRAQNVVLRGCGHMPMWDDPEQVTDVLLRGSSRG